MKTLLIATKNIGKLREIKQLFSGTSFKLVSLVEIGKNIKVEETGKTFEENAILKAKTIGMKTGMAALAEDSGLEIDAIGGKPGIYSARYTGGSDMDRVNKILEDLRGVPKNRRTARFITVMAFYDPTNHKLSTFRGVSEGYITDVPKGTNGFGYDPIFFNPELGKTNAEVSLEEKNKVSHRARALFQVRNFLSKLK